MMAILAPILTSLLSAINLNKDDLAKKAGVSTSSIQKVSSVLHEYLSKGEKLMQLEQEFMNKAREHDIKTFVEGNNLVNSLRSLVRPICTFVSLAWYVYARVHGIELIAEDYAIIGGVLAFWFGFRPFDKK